MRSAADACALAWVEHCLPGADTAARAAFASARGLALEVALRSGSDPRAAAEAGARVVTLQAWRLHDAHFLDRDPARRARAGAHVRAAIALARELGVPRVLATCGFGHELVDEPFETCRAAFAELAPLARAARVRLLVEPLSPARVGALASPEEVEALLDALDAPDVFGLALDTGHLLDAGRDVAAVLGARRHRVDELQLRGACSRVPGPELPVRDWLAALGEPPAVVCGEHAGAARGEELDALRAALSGPSAGGRGAR